MARRGYSGVNRRLRRLRYSHTRNGRPCRPRGNGGPGSDGGPGGNDSGDIADSDTGRRAGDGSLTPHRVGSGAGEVRQPIVRIANPPPDVESKPYLGWRLAVHFPARRRCPDPAGQRRDHGGTVPVPGRELGRRTTISMSGPSNCGKASLSNMAGETFRPRIWCTLTTS